MIKIRLAKAQIIQKHTLHKLQAWYLLSKAHKNYRVLLIERTRKWFQSYSKEFIGFREVVKKVQGVAQKYQKKKFLSVFKSSTEVLQRRQRIFE